MGTLHSFRTQQNIRFHHIKAGKISTPPLITRYKLVEIEEVFHRFEDKLDTNKFYRYDVNTDSLCELVDLDTINCVDDFISYLP